MGQYSFEPMKRNDLEWFISIRNSVRKYLHNTDEFNLSEAENWFDGLNDQRYFKVFFTDLKDFPQQIGYIRFKQADSKSVGEIGLDLDPQFHGLKLSFNAYVEFARANLTQTKIWTLRVRESNKRAVSLYKKLGFATIGIFYSSRINESEYLMVVLVDQVASITSPT